MVGAEGPDVIDFDGRGADGTRDFETGLGHVAVSGARPFADREILGRQGDAMVGFEGDEIVLEGRARRPPRRRRPPLRPIAQPGRPQPGRRAEAPPVRRRPQAARMRGFRVALRRPPKPARRAPPGPGAGGAAPPRALAAAAGGA